MAILTLLATTRSQDNAASKKHLQDWDSDFA
jgi:hypothetical protein